MEECCGFLEQVNYLGEYLWQLSAIYNPNVLEYNKIIIRKQIKQCSVTIEQTRSLSIIFVFYRTINLVNILKFPINRG